MSFPGIPNNGLSGSLGGVRGVGGGGGGNAEMSAQEQSMVKTVSFIIP